MVIGSAQSSETAGLGSSSIDGLADKIGQLSTDRAKAFSAASVVTKYVVVVAGAVATVAQFVRVENNTFSAEQVVGICAAIAVMVAAALLLRTDIDASEHLDEARLAVDAAQRALLLAERNQQIFAVNNARRDEVDAENDQDFGRTLSSLLAIQTMRGAIEQSMVGIRDLNNLIESMLVASQSVLAVALGFETGDDFSVCIYRAEKSEDTNVLFSLRCVAHHRASPCDVANTRPFAEGRGVVGIAYSNRSEFVIPDLQAEGVVSMFDMVGDDDANARATARERYRSMAAFPVMVAGRKVPWGVCTATTDQLGHFTTARPVSAPHHMAVQLLAEMVALAVAVHSSPTDPSTEQNPVTNNS